MSIDHSNILKDIDINELLKEAPFLYLFENDNTAHKTFDIDSMAYLQANENSFFMSAQKPDIDKIKPSKSNIKYWGPIKKQLHLFICTDDNTYDELRKKIKDCANVQGTTALILISSYMGEKLGCEPATIISFCSIILYSAIKIHKEAICAELKKSIEQEQQ